MTFLFFYFYFLIFYILKLLKNVTKFNRENNTVSYILGWRMDRGV